MSDCRLLYLEDDALMPDLVAGILDRAGVRPRIDIVSERDTFLRACADAPYDVVLSDHDVPGFPGMVALAEAKRRNPERPFVFVCGVGGREREQACLEAGADAFVAKDRLWELPFVVRRLLTTAARERREHEAGRERDALALLVGAVKRLSLARSMADVAAVVRTTARKLNGADGATFVLRDRDLCHYFDEDAIAPLWKGRRFPQSTCISGWVMQHGEPAVIEDIYVDPRIPADAYRPTFVKSLVMVPVRAESPVAAIGNYWARPHRATRREIELIQALADSTSVAMENVAVYSELERRVRARTSELVAANEDLEAFSYSVSHDLRTPVSQVIGFADLLGGELGADASAPQRRYVESILAAGNKMNALIDDLLRLGRATRVDLVRRRVDLGALARDVAAELAPAVTNRAIEWHIAEPMVVEADPHLMRVVLGNLLSNALKYTSRNARARIEVGRGESNEAELAFFVRDDGVGFDATGADRLFTPFGRLHAAHDFPGNGVGLATCRRILHRHGGRIWAESTQGAGATFHFALPRAHPTGDDGRSTDPTGGS